MSNYTYSTFASRHESHAEAQRSRVSIYFESSRLGYGEPAEISACYASAGERRESYAIAMAAILHLNEIEQAKLEILKFAGGKFVYSKVSGGYSIEDVKTALGMLSDAGIIKPVRHTTANGLPLGAEVNEKFTKYLFLDSGLLLSILDLDFGGAQSINQLILAGSEENLVNKGKLAELSVGWELVKASVIPIYAIGRLTDPIQ